MIHATKISTACLRTLYNQYGEIMEKYPDYWLNPAALVFGYNVAVIETL